QDTGDSTEGSGQQADEGMGTDEPIQQSEEGEVIEEPSQQEDMVGEEGVQQEGIYGEPTEQQAGEQPSTGVTEADVEEVAGNVFESPVMLTFKAGPLSFQASTGDYDSRAAAGF